jgi:hypothetical protein
MTITASIRNASNSGSVSVRPDNKSEVISVMVPSLSKKLSLNDLTDVDTSERKDGSLMSWDESSQTYKIRSDIDNPQLSIIGGIF